MIIRMNNNPLSDIAKDLFFPEEAPLKSLLREWAKEHATEIIMGSLEAAKNILVELIDSIALVGGGLCILLWVAGWEGAKKWIGILILADVLVKFLLGGG